MLTLPLVPDIETQNLTLREIQLGDFRDLSAFMTQPRYQRHITHRLKTDDAVQDFVRRQVAHQGDGRRRVFHLVAEERLSGDVIGDGFLIWHQDQSVEIGWGLHPALWSLGFGTEIARVMLAIGMERMKAKRVWCKIMLANKASLSLARKIGMTREKSYQDFPVGQGRFEEVDVFSIAPEIYFDLPY